MSTQLTAQQIAYFEAHADDNLVPNVIIASSISGFLSVVILTLRFVSRWIMLGRLRLDLSDWFLVVAWIFFMMFNIGWTLGTRYGIGRHIIFATDIRMLQITSIIGDVGYVLTIAFIKFSVLSLYNNIFPIRRFHYLVWSLAIFLAAWTFSGTFVAIFQCTPISYVWEPERGGFCINFGLQNLILGILNVITDAFLVAMVIPLVWKLQVSKQKRWLLLCTFAIASSACIVSIVRLFYSLQIGSVNDGAWEAVPSLIVSLVEATFGMLAVSVPTYRPLYRRIFYRSAEDLRWRFEEVTKETTREGLYGKEIRTDVNISTSRGHSHDTPPGIKVVDQIELARHENRSGNWLRVSDDDEQILREPEHAAIRTSKGRAY
ncbi:hypothetical protein GGS26DRAFT_590766 [Hypomontagnella submonticulosa]|nr:hypothetical protein GGS26DRAFT_590766 [Hypomontagnella submonticulosa]